MIVIHKLGNILATVDGANIQPTLSALKLTEEEIEVATVNESDVDSMATHSWHVDGDTVVIDAPLPPPVGPLDLDTQSEQEFYAAVEAATTIQELKAALLGTFGPGAQPRIDRRPQ